MPGLVGLANLKKAEVASLNALKEMLSIITHKDFYETDPIFKRGNVIGGRSHNNTIQKTQQPSSSENIHVWVAGEFYNQEKLNYKFGLSVNDDVDLLKSLYTSDPYFGFLEHIDGGFSAVIYDENRQQIHLISDRYGRQHLYWTKFKEQFVWSSELKAFSVLSGFKISIDRESLEDFIHLGYILGEKTWFTNVYLLPAASILSLNLESNQHKIKRYWWWDEVNSLTDNVDKKELARQTGDLLIQAVGTQCKTEIDSIGIALSGGRDSRAILAAMPDSCKSIHAITFGQRNSQDIEIAAKSAKIKNAHHHVHFLNAGNWLEERMKSIWWTDGQTSMIHLNDAIDVNSDRKLFDVCFTGLGGEVLAGKNRMFQMENITGYINHKFKKPCVSERFKKSLMKQIEEEGSAEVFYMNQRFRKFSYFGLKRGEASGVRVRVPFLDNKLIEFIHSIPYKYKKKAMLYNSILLMKFSEYFKDIMCMEYHNASGLCHNIGYYTDKTKNKLRRKLSKFGLTTHTQSQFTDYKKWICSEPAKSLFHEILSNKGALYPEYLDRKLVLKYYNEHVNGRDHHVILCRFLTFEIWLQQIFNRNYLE